jgi:hypothetical protein
MQTLVGVLSFIIILALLCVLGAYPTKWIINYLFAPEFLTTVFGVAQISVVRALVLNLFFGLFIKGGK